MSENNSRIENDKHLERQTLQIAPVKVELTSMPKNGIWLFVLLLVCGASFCIAWAVNKTSRSRILHLESKLSVLELETATIKTDGINGGFLKDHSQVGISFNGFARLGVDLSKAKFDLDRRSDVLTIELPNPEITEVSVTDSHTWDRSVNKSDGQKMDELECKLCNDALFEFRNLASNQYYIDTANQLAKSVLRAYYKRNYPKLDVQFK